MATSLTHKPLDQQVIVITGASSGIGMCTALTAANRGARLVLVARSGDTLADLCEQIADAGGEAIPVVADVGERKQLIEVARAAIARFGHIDTWINDAGVSIYGRLDQVEEEDSRRLFDTNFWGVVNGSLISLPYLKETGGTLINVGSEVSDAVVPLQGMYSASKHAVKGFTDALRVEILEVDETPISIVLIQPTAVNTPYPQHARNYMDHEPKLPTPMIDPQQVADAILDAAVEGGRDIRVGAVAVLDTIAAKVMPSLADKLAAKQVGRQQENEPAVNPEGALYQAGNTGQIHGHAPH